MEIVLEPRQSYDTVHEKADRIRQSVEAIGTVYEEAERLTVANPEADDSLTAMQCHARARRIDALNAQVTRILVECPGMPSREALGAFDLTPHIEKYDALADERWLTPCD